MSADGSLRFRAGGRTDIGVHPNRQLNEDYLFLDHELGLFAVFDACGSWNGTGERTGLVASAVMQRVIREGPDAEPRELIERAFRDAGEAIRAEPEESGCEPSSVALALLNNERIHISWLGDALAHRVTGDQIESLTQPHTVWNECIRQGITPTNEGFRNVRAHSLGNVDLPDPLEIISFAPQPGDRLVLTTDGITKHIPDNTILTACRTIADPTTCAEAIIEHALMAGSRDNCTCAVIAFERPDHTERH